MTILCSPDSFKETLSAREAALAMARGVEAAGVGAEADVCPVADGGEGTLEALISAAGGDILQARVTGPLGDPISARWGVLPNGIGVVELAEAAGLSKVPHGQRDPARTTTHGVGELIAAAIAHGCREVIIGVGGSATVDGGAAIAQALGARFIDERGKLIRRPITGGMLTTIVPVDPPTIAANLRVACDVTNPLLGPDGAAATYGPQKGATADQVPRLEAGLGNLAARIAGSLRNSGRPSEARLDPSIPGAGAAGGAAFGLMALCGATLERGIDLVLDAIRFDDRCRNASLVLTGEGRLDSQSLRGKACIGVAQRAAKFGVPAIAIVGSAGPGAEDCINPATGGVLRRYVDLTDRFGREHAMNQPAECIAQIARELVQSHAARHAQ